jgi:hypothetical protein
MTDITSARMLDLGVEDAESFEAPVDAQTVVEIAAVAFACGIAVGLILT